MPFPNTKSPCAPVPEVGQYRCRNEFDADIQTAVTLSKPECRARRAAQPGTAFKPCLFWVADSWLTTSTTDDDQANESCSLIFPIPVPCLAPERLTHTLGETRRRIVKAVKGKPVRIPSAPLFNSASDMSVAAQHSLKRAAANIRRATRRDACSYSTDVALSRGESLRFRCNDQAQGTMEEEGEWVRRAQRHIERLACLGVR